MLLFRLFVHISQTLPLIQKAVCIFWIIVPEYSPIYALCGVCIGIVLTIENPSMRRLNSSCVSAFASALFRGH